MKLQSKKERKLPFIKKFQFHSEDEKILLIDEGEKIVSCSQSFLEDFKYSNRELRGKNFLSLFDTSKVELKSEGSKEGFPIKKPQLLVDKKGKKHRVLLSISPLPIEERELYCVIVRDYNKFESEETRLQNQLDGLNIQTAINQKLQQCETVQQLFKVVIEELLSLRQLKLQRKGGVFLIESAEQFEGSLPCGRLPSPPPKKFLNLVYQVGNFSAEFLNKEKCIPLGRCLCGKAAVSGELIISDNCFEDPQHHYIYSDMTPHGHYIVPIKDKNRVFGVLFLYTEPYPERDIFRITLLNTIGIQVGLLYKRLKMEEELRRSYDKMKQIAMYDELTQIMNRRSLFRHLHREWARASRKNTEISILLMDIDFFKKINDSYGHQVGDAVLRELASRIKDSVRPYDGLGRYGGEEFLLVLSECSIKEAVKVAERIRQVISSTPFTIGDLKLFITISIGIAATSNPTVETPDELIRKADIALYRAKNSGRNCIRTFPDISQYLSREELSSLEESNIPHVTEFKEKKSFSSALKKNTNAQLPSIKMFVRELSSSPSEENIDSLEKGEKKERCLDTIELNKGDIEISDDYDTSDDYDESDEVSDSGDRPKSDRKRGKKGMVNDE